ncbi:MAG: hypothetical protein R3277_02655 [Brumimicrobium sp.]|nr:hypothetical protein [Brumimicrobium sp.]
MKSLILGLTLLAITAGCKKGENFCEAPQELNGFIPLENSYDATSPITVELNYIFDYGQEIHEHQTLFTFSVPDIFDNPKGNDRPIDTVDEPKYTYVVKDTTNVPDSVLIEGYAFNDCGKSEVARAYIKFN